MVNANDIRNCAIVVHLKQTEQVSGNDVLFEACRVGSVNAEDGSMVLKWDLGELTRVRPSLSTQAATKKLAALLFHEVEKNDQGEIVRTEDNQILKGETVCEAVTAGDGSCTFEGIEEGTWLIHAKDSRAYGTIEDTLVAVPCYIEQGKEWNGPIYRPEVWPKGDPVTLAQSDPPSAQTEPGQTEPRQTEPRQTEPRQTEPETKTEKSTPDPGQTESVTAQTDPVTKQTEPVTERTVTSPPESITTDTDQQIEKTPETVPSGTSTSESVPPAKKTETNRPKKEKDHPSGQTITGQTSSQPTQVVRTLDDTPLSGLIFMCLSSAILIGMILIKIRRSLRPGSAEGGRFHCFLLAVLGAGIFCGTQMLICPGVRAMASEENGTSWIESIDQEKKVVFVNEAPEVPCLTVSKEVLDALNGSRAPEGDQFTFRLLIDQKKAAGIRYRVFTEQGTELVSMSGSTTDLVEIGSVTGTPAALRTGRDGTFSLKDGQSALFEDISIGDLWEVKEMDAEHYERVSPQASDTVSGTISSKGDHAEFVNRYTPPDDGGGKEGDLEITKFILWPDACTLPDRGTFRIRVSIDEKPWADADVELTDLTENPSEPAAGTTGSSTDPAAVSTGSSTDPAAVSTGSSTDPAAVSTGSSTDPATGSTGSSIVLHTKTDKEGCFLISGNQRAVLHDLPVGADARVEEIDDTKDLFVPSGDVTWKGAISTHTKVRLTNRLASFAVKKSVKGEAEDRRFSFCLTDRDGAPMKDTAYFVVDENGQVQSAQALVTDEDGCFRLRAGETAVFSGMEEGTAFNVREESAFGYRQVTPEGEDGYTGQSVRNGIQTLLFENEKTAVKLFAPSAGGPGIVFLMAAALTGMVILSYLMIGKRRSGQKADR